MAALVHCQEKSALGSFFLLGTMTVGTQLCLNCFFFFWSFPNFQGSSFQSSECLLSHKIVKQEVHYLGVIRKLIMVSPSIYWRLTLIPVVQYKFKEFELNIKIRKANTVDMFLDR